jgi:phosphate:Na+ symporter
VTATAATTLLGGIGLFLLGMSLMTDSLQALGGHALRRLVRVLTRSRWYALLTGAAMTATLQSSSATTLTPTGSSCTWAGPPARLPSSSRTIHDPI